MPNAADFRSQGETEVTKVVLKCNAVKNLDENKLIKFEISKNGDKKVEAEAGSWEQTFYLKNKLKVVDLKSLDTSKVTDMSKMFAFCTQLTDLDLSSFDTAQVIYMKNMFNFCTRLINLNISSFNTENVKFMNDMFKECKKLTKLDLSKFNTSKVRDMQYMFSECTELTELIFSENFKTDNVTNMKCMFWGCKNLINLDVSKFNTANVEDMSQMFSRCSNIKELDVSTFDTSKATEMQFMFYDCENLISIDVSKFKTDNVTNMYGMFDGCKSLTELDVSSFNTSKVTEMSSMFSNCSGLTKLDVSNFVTDNVTKMDGMFNKCAGLISLNLSNFKTENVTSMGDMFNGCTKLVDLNISSFTTEKATKMYRMFQNCNSIKELDLSNFVTSNVDNMKEMFSRCTELTKLNLLKFNTSNVKNMEGMFEYCPNLLNLDVLNFVISESTKLNGMFSGFKNELFKEDEISEKYMKRFKEEGYLKDKTDLPKVETVNTQSKSVGGKYKNGTKIIISYNNPESIQKTEKDLVMNKGKWKLDLEKPLPLNTEIKVRQKADNRRWSKEVIVTVQAAQADSEITIPTEKVKVDNPAELTEQDKNNVKEAIKNANQDKHIKDVIFAENGEITIKFEDGSEKKLEGTNISDLVEEDLAKKLAEAKAKANQKITDAIAKGLLTEEDVKEIKAKIESADTLEKVKEAETELDALIQTKTNALNKAKEEANKQLAQAVKDEKVTEEEISSIKEKIDNAKNESEVQGAVTELNNLIAENEKQKALSEAKAKAIKEVDKAKEDGRIDEAKANEIKEKINNAETVENVEKAASELKKIFDKNNVKSMIVKVQPKLDYVEGKAGEDKLDLSKLVIELTDENGNKKDVSFNEFENYEISTSLENGISLTKKDHNAKSITITKAREGKEALIALTDDLNVSIETPIVPEYTTDEIIPYLEGEVEPSVGSDGKQIPTNYITVTFKSADKLKGLVKVGSKEGEIVHAKIKLETDLAKKVEAKEIEAKANSEHEFVNWTPKLAEVKEVAIYIANFKKTEAPQPPTPVKKSKTPTVNKIKEGDKEITGNGEVGAEIVVELPDGTKETKKVDEKGEWKVGLPEGKELKENGKIKVTQQEAGKEVSEVVEVTIGKGSGTTPSPSP